MKIEDIPDWCYEVQNRPRPGATEAWRVVFDNGRYRIRHMLNDPQNGIWSVETSRESYGTHKEAIAALKEKLLKEEKGA